MRNIILITFFILSGLNVFATGIEHPNLVGLKKYPQKINLKKINYLDEYPNPLITLQLGGMWLNNNAKLSINSGKFDLGTSVDLDKDLGINPNSFAPTGELYLRLGKRHQIVVSAFGYSRHKTKTLNKDIQFGDSIFHANASIKGKTHFIAYNFDYRFSIYRVPRSEIGLTIGAKVYDVLGSMEAVANQNQIGFSQRKRFFAPALLPGIHGSAYITDKLLFRGIAQYFKLSVNDWKFKVYEFKTSLEYYFIPSLGIGVAYSYSNIGVSKVPSDKLNGEVKYIIGAGSLFASIRF